MITPLFKVDQDENFIYLKIKVKYVKISDVDFYIEKNNFKFYLKPYYLNLNFSDNLVSESEKNSSTYDIEQGILECRIEKEVPGTEFKNLDLISTLIITNSNANSNINVQKKIEEISINNDKSFDTSLFDQIKNNVIDSITDENSLNDYLVEYMTKEKENLPFNLNTLKLSTNSNFPYGFNNEFNDVFQNRVEEMVELSELNPEKVELKHRFFKKMEIENEEFSPERYFYDLDLEKEDDLYKSALNLNLDKYFSKHSQNDNNFNFNEKELNTIMSINKTKLNLLDTDTNIHFNFYLQSIDILFAFLYDLRVSEFEHNSESGWTINKLSAVLSDFLDFKNVFYSFSDVAPFDYLDESIKHILISSYRRVLCYPLYRNIKICDKIKSDLSTTLSKGLFFILKFFLRVRTIFESSEPRHILNKIYIDNFIQWIQFYSNPKIWNIISKVIERVKIEKKDLKLDLEEIEEEFKEYKENDEN